VTGSFDKLSYYESGFVMPILALNEKPSQVSIDEFKVPGFDTSREDPNSKLDRSFNDNLLTIISNSSSYL
jgi:hypothetical protein